MNGGPRLFVMFSTSFEYVVGELKVSTLDDLGSNSLYFGDIPTVLSEVRRGTGTPRCL